MLLVCPFLVRQYSTEEEVYRLLSIIVLANLYSVVMLIAKTPWSDWGNERVGMSIGVDRNSVGMRCAVASLMCLSLYRRNGRFLYLPVIAVLLGVAFMTGSRKVVFIVGTGMIGLTVLDSFSHDNLIRHFANIIRLLIILLLSYLVMTRIDAVRNVLWSRVEALLSYLMGKASSDTSTSTREWFREYAMMMWRKRPLFGWGLAGFEAEMSRIRFVLVGYSHNNYTELLATLGIVGLAIYYSMHLRMLVILPQGLSKDCGIKRLALVLLLVMCVAEYGFVSFVDVDAYYYLATIYCAARLTANENSVSEVIL